MSTSREEISLAMHALEYVSKGGPGSGRYSMHVTNHVQTPSGSTERITVQARDPQGKPVGAAEFVHDTTKKNLEASDVHVQPEHRRRGVASQMYEHAEKITGMKTVPSQRQSKDAQAFWANPNRKFGKKD